MKYFFKCRCCGLPGIAAKADDVPGDVHAELAHCFAAMRLYVDQLCGRAWEDSDG